MRDKENIFTPDLNTHILKMNDVNKYKEGLEKMEEVDVWEIHLRKMEEKSHKVEM